MYIQLQIAGKREKKRRCLLRVKKQKAAKAKYEERYERLLFKHENRGVK